MELAGNGLNLNQKYYHRARTRGVDMKNKVGRNDPCPCGSGKKYKKCCLGKVEDEGEGSLEETLQEINRPLNRLALDRFDQEVLEDPETQKRVSTVIKKTKMPGAPFQDLRSFQEYISKKWSRKKLKMMQASEIIGKLSSMNVNFNECLFKEQIQNHVSAIRLSEDHYYTQNWRGKDDLDEDFIWLAITELWDRLSPEKPNVEQIDYLMQEGFVDIEKNNYKGGLEKWGKTWDMIKSVVPKTLRSVEEVDAFFDVLTQSVSNWCQDYEIELHNGAIREGSAFWEKRISYCHAFCQIFPDSDEEIIQNMMIGEGESYTALRNFDAADRVFYELVRKFPCNAWNYIAWGDQYFYSDDADEQDFDKAEKMYRLGLAYCILDREDIQERLYDLDLERKKLTASGNLK
jgi:hypothetical protein